MGSEHSDKAISRRQLLKVLAVAGLAVGGGSVLASGCSTAQAPAATPATGQVAGKPDVDAAKKEGVVSLYTSLDTAILDKITGPFKDKYGIDVKYYRGGAREVSTKLQNEWDAKQYLCDVLDVSDLPTILVMKGNDMLVPYRAATWDAFPAELKDKDGYWCGDRLTQIVIGYNTSIIKGADVPKGWTDLADPKYSGKLVVQEPSTATVRIYTVVANLKDGWDWLAKVGKNKPKYVQQPQNSLQMNETGEIPISFMQNDNLVARSKDSGKPVDLVFPQEGLPTEPGVLAYMANASHPNAGRLFIDWWLGDEGQKANVAGFKYSPRADMDPPKGCPKLSTLTLWQEDNAYLEKNMNDVSDKILKAMNG